VVLPGVKNGCFCRLARLAKVALMPNFDSNVRFNRRNCRLQPETASEKDLIMEQILDNLNTTPIGQVLKKIAALPELSQDKILNVRNQLTSGKYDLNDRLDIALDKVLEDLTT
jgi:hypothetical protein